ncbi:MAG: bifunctional homocysteine S-methyltransferase/methylenetetrahydrofolate reductase [Phycisphaerae bacterium]|nr:bifunctional homocysteine S-methyltransferase/methylenetetrahydrofolate reductase [Phycisphaerae bacterium]
MNKQEFVKLLKKKTLVADGAMGTMLYGRGVFVNQCFEELNLSNAKLVGQIHAAYVEAGADIIETNTFGANQFKLSRYGLTNKVEQINQAAVKIVKAAIGDNDILTAGSVGPSGLENFILNKEAIKELSEAFGQQCQMLAKAGADILFLETFANIDELLIAIDAAASTGLAVTASITVNERNESLYGQPIEKLIEQINAKESVAAIGLNCSVGPSGMLDSLEKITGLTDKPICVQPNAGMPRQIENRMLYMCTPEYMAEYAKKFFEKGARIIGGCCGTTPQHIKQIAQSVRSMDKAYRKSAVISVSVEQKTQHRIQEKPLTQKSRFAAKLAAGEKVTTIEVTPPRGIDTSDIIEKARLCGKMGVDAINIPDGPRASSRLSPMITSIKIQQNADIESILHVCCRDRNLIGIQSDILGADAAGIHNLLLVTGDPPKMGDYPQATGVFDLDSVALTGVVKHLNCGIDIGANTIDPPTGILIGVGANPVAADIDREIERFKAKVKAGAEYAITQPVFDTDMLFEFMEKTQDFKIPIIAGIWPFTSFKNAEFMANEVPGVVVPEKLLTRMAQAKTKEQGRAIGIEIAREMIEQIESTVAGFAVSAPFGNVKIALAVLGKLDINEVTT